MQRRSTEVSSIKSLMVKLSQKYKIMNMEVGEFSEFQLDCGNILRKSKYSQQNNMYTHPKEHKKSHRYSQYPQCQKGKQRISQSEYKGLEKENKELKDKIRQLTICLQKERKKKQQQTKQKSNEQESILKIQTHNKQLKKQLMEVRQLIHEQQLFIKELLQQ